MNDDHTRDVNTISRRAALGGLGAGGVGLALATARLASAQNATPTPDAEANTQLVERLVAAIHAGDPSQVDALLAPDYIQHQPGVPPGREGFKQFISALGPTPFQILHTIAQSDLVMVHAIIPAADPTAAPVRELLDLFRIAGGRVAEHWGAANVAASSGTPTASSTPAG